MLRSFARDTFVQRAAHRQTLRIPSNASTILALSCSRHLCRTDVTPFARLLSSSVPPPLPGKNTSPTHAQSIPPNSSTHRKPKVDLRPGPIKPPKSTSPTSKLPQSLQVPVHPSTLLPHTSPTVETVTEATKRDIADAEKHGIINPPPHNANWFKRMTHKVVELFKFYYRGVKMIFTHRKRAAEIQKRVKAGGAPLTRSEYRFIRTYRDDITKLIPFILIVIVLEEIIPLIAIYAPFMLPSTCILPSQRIRIQEKKTEKAIIFSTMYHDVFNQLRQIAESGPGYLPLRSLTGRDASTAICGLLRLSTVGPDLLRIRRIKRHLAFITEDDRLLMQESMGAHLSSEELYAALEERGIVLAKPSLKDQHSRLRWWLTSVNKTDKGDHVSRRLLTTVTSL